MPSPDHAPSRIRRVAALRRLAAVLLLLLCPVVAHAHGHLKSSQPSAGAHLGTVPRELRLQFNQVPELAFARITLSDDDGRSVPLGPVTYDATSRRTVVAAITRTLAPGTYTVHWQLAGDDGHPVRGSFDFTVAPGAVGIETEPPAGAVSVAPPMVPMHHDPASMPQGTGFGAESAPYVLLRWAQFCALLLAIGAVSFRQLVLRRARHAAPVQEGAAAMAHRATAVGLYAAAALAVTLLGRLLAQSWAMHGAGEALDVTRTGQMIATTTWGHGWLVQALAVIVTLSGFRLARRGRANGWTFSVVGVILLALSAALTGHAAAMPTWRGVAIAADVLHVLAASSWLGTLAVILLVALARGAPATEQTGVVLSPLVAAFSPVALASAAVVVVTGGMSGWMHLGRVAALWQSRYGVTLLVKLAVLSVVAAAGFYNWRVVQPRLASQGDAGHLRRSAMLEVLVTVVVLLVTAVLVATPTALDAGT